MESHTKESDQQREQKEDGGEISSQLDSAMLETRTDTTVPANEQSQSEERVAQDTSNLDESEARVESEERLSNVTSVIEEAKEQTEDKDLAYEKKVKEIQANIKTIQELKEILIQREPSNVDRHSQFETVSELGGAFLEECLPSTSTNPQIEDVSGRDLGNIEIRDLPSDTATSSTDASSVSLSKSSEPIAIPSTSRDLSGLEPEPSSPNKPNIGSHAKQSIFHPRNTTSILKKYPIPLRKGHIVYLRDSPESSDYGGSPDSLEDPFLMEALYSSENKETEDLDSSESSELTLRPQTPIDSEEIEKSLNLTEPSLDDQPSESTEPSLDDQPSEFTEPSLDDQPSEFTEPGLDDQPSESTEPSLDDQPSESMGLN